MDKIDPGAYSSYTHIMSGGRFVLSAHDLPIFREGDEVMVSQGERLIFFGVVETSSTTRLVLVSADYSLDRLQQVSFDRAADEVIAEYADTWDKLASGDNE